MLVHVARVWDHVSVIRVDRVLDCVSVCTCKQSLVLCGSCECVYVWTKLRIVSVYVRVNIVCSSVESVCT